MGPYSPGPALTLLLTLALAFFIYHTCRVAFTFLNPGSDDGHSYRQTRVSVRRGRHCVPKTQYISLRLPLHGRGQVSYAVAGLVFQILGAASLGIILPLFMFIISCTLLHRVAGFLHDVAVATDVRLPAASVFVACRIWDITWRITSPICSVSVTSLVLLLFGLYRIVVHVRRSADSSYRSTSLIRKLWVRGYGSKPWNLEIEHTATVQEVIQELGRKYKLRNTAQQRLFQSSRLLPLSPAARIADLGLDELSVLTLKVPLRGGARAAPNPRGRNQWGDGSIISRHPELPDIIQGYLNKKRSRATILEYLRIDHPHITHFSLKTLGNIIRDCNLQTTRSAHIPAVEAGAAIVAYVEHDLVRRQGYRKIFRELCKKGVHIPRDFVENFVRAMEPAAVAARHPTSQKLHTATIQRTGPNEEWSCDGHHKLLPEMGLYVWGVVDVYSRRVLQHYVVKNASIPEVVRALFLRTAKKTGGIPFQASLDQGSETNHAAAIQVFLRMAYHTADVDVYPAYSGLKSVYNITVERQWRPLFKEKLSNVLIWFRAGKHGGIYHEQNPDHYAVMQWVWARVVQRTVTEWVDGRNSDYIRKQDDAKLPTAGQPDDFFFRSHKWGGRDCLVPVPADVLSSLIEEYSPPDMFHFGTPDIEEHCETVYRDELHSVALDVQNAWAVVRYIITKLPL